MSNVEVHMRSVATLMRLHALRGTFEGRQSARNERYVNRCRRVDDVTGATILFTRDTGHHTSGWWKNPDYERCWHLSLSAAPSRLILPGVQRTELNAKTRDAWVLAFFQESASLVWHEPAYSDIGKANGVTHWRVFCDEAWAPILPRGEVYSRELTEAGWKSWSDVQAAIADAHAADGGGGR